MSQLPGLFTGFGAASDFDAAANDLSSLVLAIEDVGDQALAAAQYDAAVAAYQGASTNGLRVAQKIAAAGAQLVTAPLLAQAALQAAKVAATPAIGASQAQAGEAGVACNKMGQLYSQAIVDGKASLTAPPSPPTPPAPTPTTSSTTDYTVPVVVGAAALGLGIIAVVGFGKPRGVARAVAHASEQIFSRRKKRRH